MSDKQGREEDDRKVDDQGCRHSHDGDDLMDDLMSLRSEEHKDREEQTNQRPRAYPFEKFRVIEFWACYVANSEASDDRSSQGNAKEDGDTRGNGTIRDVKCFARATDDRDEEERKRSVEDHLENGVYGNQDGTVLVVTTSEASPNEYLQEIFQLFSL